ncbi:MAG: hypothetical protein ABI885_11045 [Gammaproteobacteria bacterium]
MHRHAAGRGGIGHHLREAQPILVVVEESSATCVAQGDVVDVAGEAHSAKQTAPGLRI